MLRFVTSFTGCFSSLASFLSFLTVLSLTVFSFLDFDFEFFGEPDADASLFSLVLFCFYFYLLILQLRSILLYLSFPSLSLIIFASFLLRSIFPLKVDNISDCVESKPSID
jgi:asparagine N-glycosylation enzyme membrane subunit Stt3